MDGAPLPYMRVRFLFSIGAVGVLLGGLFFPPPVAAVQTPQPDTAQPADVEAQQLFIRGLTQVSLDDYDEAVSYFQEALNRVPNQPSVLISLAESEAARDNLTSALFYARKARDQAPDRPSYRRTLAELQKQTNQLEEAVTTYRELLDRFPNDDEARLQLAQLQKRLGRPDEAIRLYERLIDSTEYPRYETEVQLLELYRQRGRTNDRERILNRLIDRYPRSSSFRRELGELYVEQNRYADALPLFEGLVREHPEDLEFLTRLKGLYEQTDQPEQAEAFWEQLSEEAPSPDQLVARAQSMYERSSDPSPDSSLTQRTTRLLRQVLDQNPKHVEALDLLGTVRYDAGAYAEAASLLKRALAEDARNRARWVRAASAHLRMHAYTQAADLAEEGRLLFPGDVDLLRIEAFARLRRGDHDRAETHFRNALSRLDTTRARQNRAMLYAGLGRVHHHKGAFERSDSTFKRALGLAPEHRLVLLEYAVSLADRDEQLDRALALSQRAVQEYGSDPNVLHALGWTHFKTGDLSAAQRYLQQAVSTTNPSARTLEHFATVLEALGKEEQAQAYREKALKRQTTPDTTKTPIDVPR